MSITVDYDFREFNAALKQYTLATSKDTEAAINGKLRDLMFRAAQKTERAVSRDISALRGQAWWVKYIARQVAKEQPGLSRREFKREAKKLSRKILAARRRAVGYARAGFVEAGNKLPSNDASKKGRAKRDWPVRVMITKATATRHKAETTIDWPAEGARDAARKQRIALKGLRASLQFVTRDMERYLERKARAAARRVSV